MRRFLLAKDARLASLALNKRAETRSAVISAFPIIATSCAMRLTSMIGVETISFPIERYSNSFIGQEVWATHELLKGNRQISIQTNTSGITCYDAQTDAARSE